MKKFIALFTVLASLSAHAMLEVHFGQMSFEKGKHTCTFTNNTDKEMDFKYVRFNLERRFGRAPMKVARERIDTIVYPGETITERSKYGSVFIGRYCAFLAR